VSRKDEKIRETRWFVYHRDGGVCQTCGKKVPFAKGQLAHRIPQRKNFLEKYGSAIIHHAANFKWTCPTDKCNNAQSVAGDPQMVYEIVKFIVTEILSEVATRMIAYPHLYRKEFDIIAKIADGEV